MASDRSRLPLINVSAYRSGETLHVDLTDCRALHCRAQVPFDAPLLARLAATLARPADGEAARVIAAGALYRQLLPGAVGAVLRSSRARALNLQLAADLDELPWELAAEAGEPLNERFQVTRHLVGDDIAPPPPVWSPAREDLRVVTLDATLAAGAEAPSIRLPMSAIGTPAGRALLAQCHVLRVVGESLWPAMQALLRAAVPSGGTGLPARLWVGTLPHAADRVACVHRACQLGAAVVAADVAADDRWFAELTHLLGAGLPVVEAVTRLSVLADPFSARRRTTLYGQADSAIVLRSAGDLDGHDRRQVTALSFDVVDSTTVLGLDKEHYANAITDMHNRCKMIVLHHGGVSCDPQGNDGFMSYFGYPLANERVPEQAVAAALQIAQSLVDPQLAVRVGVATGEVVVKVGQLYGPAIHLAARLQAAAEPGSVLVSRTTQLLVRHRFELHPLLQELVLKGFQEPQAAYKAVGVARKQAEVGLAMSPFVGRGAELALLERLWRDTERGGARVVLVGGDAGIGKSRLVFEFRHLLKSRGLAPLQCNCSADAAASAFRALADCLRRLLDIRESDDAAEALRKVHATHPAWPKDAETERRIAMLLGLLPDAEAQAADGGAERQRQRSLATLVQWFCDAASQAPVCLVVEDVHWIDRSTAEFLDQLLTRGRRLPLLMVMTRRSDLDNERRGEAATDWHPALVTERMDLQGLSAAAARSLVEGVPGERGFSEDVVRLLTDRADGVPLFLEESARMALELGHAIAQDLNQLGTKVPDKLMNLLRARLERLGPAMLVVQLASVLGREFSATLLQSVLSHGRFSMLAVDLEGYLSQAERSGLLAKLGGRDDGRYRFKHALICDDAYDSLWERHRKIVHLAVVTSLRGPLNDLAARQPELLAHHLAGAELDMEALDQWQEAAKSATARSANHESISHLNSALALLARRRKVIEDGDRIELRLQRRLASRYIATAGYGAPQVEQAYKRAAELCHQLSDDAALLTVTLGLEGYHFMRADFARAREIAHRAEAMAERSPDPMHRLQVKWAFANISFHQGDGLGAVAQMDECLASYRSDLHYASLVQDPAVMCLCYSGWGQWELGHPDDALQRIEGALALAQGLRHKFSLAEAHAFAINVHHYRGEWPAALASAEQCLALCDEGGFQVWRAHALVMHGRLLCEFDRVAEGLVEMGEGNALWASTGAVVTRPLYLAMHAEGLARSGDPAQGLALLAQATAIAQDKGERYYEAELRRLTALLTLQLGAQERRDVDAEVEQGLLDAHALALSQHKRGFALRSATDLARLWISRGRLEAALRLLAQALVGWSEGAQTLDLRAARTLLQSIDPLAEPLESLP